MAEITPHRYVTIAKSPNSEAPRSLTQNTTITVLILFFYSALLKATLVPKPVSSGAEKIRWNERKLLIDHEC